MRDRRRRRAALAVALPAAVALGIAGPGMLAWLPFAAFVLALAIAGAADHLIREVVDARDESDLQRHGR